MATSTAKKSPAKARAAAKPDSAAKPRVSPPAALSDGAEPVEKAAKSAAPQLKKKDLVQRVVAAMDGRKKGGVKEIVEATLAALGEAVKQGESLNLPPFGRLRVAKQKGEGSDRTTTIRMRGAGEKNAPKAPKQALAEVGEAE